MRELPGIEAIPAIVKPSKKALSFNFLLISFCPHSYQSFLIFYIISIKKLFSENNLIKKKDIFKENIS